MDFDPVFGQGTDVTDIVLIAVEELDERLRVGEFSDLSLIDSLSELAPHGIEHHLGQGTESRVLLDFGGIETNAFSSIIRIDVGLFLSRGGTSFGPAAGFFFDLEPRVHVGFEEPRTLMVEMPYFVYVLNDVTFLYSHVEFGGAPGTHEGTFFVRVMTGVRLFQKGFGNVLFDAGTT